MLSNPFQLHESQSLILIAQAENFFLESLESWRQAQGIEVMTLIGHSLGGYLSTVSPSTARPAFQS